MRAAERRCGDEVVGDLRDHAGPVDGVDAGQLDAVAERQVVEHGLQEGLAIVERAVDGDGMHVGFGGGRHHAPLHVGHASVREQDDGVDAFGAAESLDGGAARVARRGADDCDAGIAGSKHTVHEAGNDLHGHVLEGQRRPVEQLQNPRIGTGLDKRRHGGMPEARIGIASDGEQLAARNGVARKQAQDRCRHVGEGLAGKRRRWSRGPAGARLSARRARRRAPNLSAERRQSRVRGLRLWC